MRSAVAVGQGAGFGLRVRRKQGALTARVAIEFALHDSRKGVRAEGLMVVVEQFAGLRNVVDRGRRVAWRLTVELLVFARVRRQEIIHNKQGSL